MSQEQPDDYFDGANHRLLALVPEAAKTILDVGCARGALGAAIKSQCEGREVWGIEQVPSVAEAAKTRLDHVLVGDIERMDPLPLPERYFDCVTCGDVLEHLRDPASVLARLKGHIKKDGALLCCVPNIAHWSVLLGLLRGRFDYEDQGLLDRTHVHFFTPVTVREMLWDAGYIVTHEESSDMGHPGVEAAIGQLAQALGQDRERAEKASRTYQQIYATKLKPNPFEDPEKMQILLGHHVGKLGPASKRCSIVIVTYNNEKDIEDCLKSVIAAVSPDDELIVYDNCSSDKTTEKVRKFVETEGRLSLMESDENLGFSKAVNQGILVSRGEFILSLNPDTRVWPGVIESLVNPLMNPHVGAAGPVSDNVAGDAFIGRFVPSWKPDWDTDRSYQEIRSQPRSVVDTRMLIGYCLALRRQALDVFGLLDETTSMGADDLELSWRYQELGLKLKIVTNEFVHHRGRSSFATVSHDQAAAQIRNSDQALLSKMAAYYGSLPTSHDVWRSEILQV